MLLVREIRLKQLGILEQVEVRKKNSGEALSLVVRLLNVGCNFKDG